MDTTRRSLAVAASREPDSLELQRAIIAIAVMIAAVVAFLAFAPPRDPSKVVSAYPCSVLSETQISAVMGAPMRLMPTSGSVCQYASTTGNENHTLFVIARTTDALPTALARGGVPVAGIGDGAVRLGSTLYIRTGDRAYRLSIVPEFTSDTTTVAEEIQLAKLMHHPMVAANR
ncbi:MAG: hypothetical protein JO164_10655 [Candidatus Eremiobacteraeota bacterium]|nr:hypothetical protein [Candidatus Eremiobacteraeota bacterium]